MKPPLANATLTSIAGGGTSEDYDTGPGADTARWTGSVDAYLQERLEAQVAGQQLDAVDVSRLVVPLAEGLNARRGDTVTYSYGGETFSRTVQHLEQYRIFGTVSLWFYNG